MRETEIDAELLALYAVPPMMLGPAVPGRPCECGCTTRKRRSALTEIVDEFRLRWDPHWPDDWIPWQALAGLLVVAAVWLWNRGAR